MARVTQNPQAAGRRPRRRSESLMQRPSPALAVQNYSEYTVHNRQVHIGFFLQWCLGARARASPSKSRGQCWNAISGICSTTARRTASR